MATVSLCIVSVDNVARSGLNAVMPVADAVPSAKQNITTSGSAQASTISSPTNAKGFYWEIYVSGGPVWIKFAPAGNSASVASGDQRLVGDGERVYYSCAPSQQFEVIDAS